MRSLHFFPLTFVAGSHGFVLFACYMALVMMVMQVVATRRKRAAARPQPEETASMPFDLPAEAIAGV